MTDQTTTTRPLYKKSQRFGYWVHVVGRVCRSCGHLHWIVAGDTRRPINLPPGAIRCVKCGDLVTLG